VSHDRGKKRYFGANSAASKAETEVHRLNSALPLINNSADPVLSPQGTVENEDALS